MKFLSRVVVPVFNLVVLAVLTVPVNANEFVGQFEKTLVPNREDFEQMVFRKVNGEAWRSLDAFDPAASFTSRLLMHPQTGKESVLSLLLEPTDDDPILYCDVNGDGRFGADEKFVLKQEKKDNPFLWNATIPLLSQKGFFEAYPIFVRYFKSIRRDGMSEGDRLITQTTEVMARGTVDVGGRKVVVQYALPANATKVDPQKGWLGVDADGDGEVDMDNLSPEAAEADSESVIFRVGDLYVSTKKADVTKNQIVLRQHEAKEYKRLELAIGKEFPEFSFVDFDNRKRNFSEFRGKYVLLDVWGFWCPPCRKELPYIREAHKRFAGRNLEIVGLNTDRDYTLDSMKKALKDSGMLWTNAKVDSIAEFIGKSLRITSFPTTFLISPEGKILSMSRQERDEPDLRGADLLETLDEILPESP